MAFSADEQSRLLLKKLLGKPSTLDTREYFQEPSRPSRPAVYQNQLYADVIPSTAPADLTSLTGASLDDDGNVLQGSYVGRTSSTSPHIKRYIGLPLTGMTGAGGASYEALSATRSHPNGYANGSTVGNLGSTGTYTRVLQNAVPFNYDDAGSYYINIYKANSGATLGAEIPAGSTGGSAVVDVEGGVVTFYAYENLTGVSDGSPPTISFYRYIGDIGLSTSATVISDLLTTTNEFTEPQEFIGGATSGSSDSLQAIIIDDRDFSTVTGLAMALQFGGNADGSWRFTINSSGTTATSLSIQARSANTWVTKSSYTA
jgi:hypothetical protein